MVPIAEVFPVLLLPDPLEIAQLPCCSSLCGSSVCYNLSSSFGSQLLLSARLVEVHGSSSSLLGSLFHNHGVGGTWTRKTEQNKGSSLK